MSDRFFFDTNMLVYSVSAEPDKSVISARLLKGGGVVSVQVLNELVNVCRRKLKLPWSTIDLYLEPIRLAMEIVPLSIEVHERGLWLTQNHSFALYDAMIVSAAQLAGCSVLYTEDMNAGFVTGGLTLVNPFAGQ